MDVHLTVKNFRSIEHAAFWIRPGLTVLVGSNGSGKTNVLQALRFLSSVLSGGAAVALGKAGGPKRNFRRGQESIEFTTLRYCGRVLYKGHHVHTWLQWELRLSLGKPDQVVQVSSETVSILGNPGTGYEHILTLGVTRSADGLAKTRSFLADDKHLTKKVFEGASIGNSRTPKATLLADARRQLAEVAAQAKKFPADSSLLEAVQVFHSSIQELVRDLRGVDEYNLQPDAARTPTDPMPITRMGTDGAHVAEVINALESGQVRRLASPFGLESQSYLARNGYHGVTSVFDYALFARLARENPLEKILEHLKAAISSIDGIGTEIDVSTGRRYVVFKSNGERFRPEEVSDGTMKWLCLLVASLVPHSRVMILEEPENFMHPWMQQRFVSLLRDQCSAFGTSAVFSTHSATLLNALNLPEVVVVFQKDGSTVVQEVKDDEALKRALSETSFGLGDIWVSGGIGGVTGVT
jgi:predicted ATPase